MVESVARTRGYVFSPERVAAVVPEVRRLQELVRRLRELPIDDEGPAVRFSLT
jgi:predicted component of type VI protein secretion system